MEVRRLTKNEELTLLEMAKDLKCVDYGSSRAVYCFEYKGISYALKLFLDIQGETQTNQEIDVFTSQEVPVAHIYAVGSRCLITEWVDVLEFAVQDAIMNNETWQEFLESFPNEQAPINEQAFKEGREVVKTLAYFSGGTSDDAQIGYSFLQEQLVAYDYGYNDGECCSEDQIGDMGEYVERYKNLIEIAINQIYYDEELWDCSAVEEYEEESEDMKEC